MGGSGGVSSSNLYRFYLGFLVYLFWATSSQNHRRGPFLKTVLGQTKVDRMKTEANKATIPWWAPQCDQ
jgi:hypothetical protein